MQELLREFVWIAQVVVIVALCLGVLAGLSRMRL